MEARRSARITTNLRVAIEGVDERPVLRRGDLSSTGIYFELDRAVGAVGSVQRLWVSPADGAEPVPILARVIRVVSADDLQLGAITVGAAFEFMPESPEHREALEQLVRTVVGAHFEIDAMAPIHHQFDAKIDDLHRATIYRLGVRGMLLETERPLAIGDTILVAIQPPGAEAPIRIEAQAVNVAPVSSTSFRVELRIQSEYSAHELADGTEPGATMAGRIDRLFAHLIVPPDHGGAPPSRKEHLVGALSRIRLPSLLALFEMERMSGVAELIRDGDLARVYVSDGRVVDVVYPAGPETPRAMLAALIEWDEGTFEFRVGAIDRPDRLGSSITGLLLDLAREHDEAHR